MSEKKNPEAEDAALAVRNAALREKLSARTPQPAEDTGPDTSTAKSGIAQAWRLSSEFVAGVLVGTGLGWAIDWFFGTQPWGLIIFVLLGFAAAVVNVMRASGQMAPSRLHIHQTKDEDHAE